MRTLRLIIFGVLAVAMVGVFSFCETASAASAAQSSSAKKKSKKKHSSEREQGQKAPTPDRISEIQSALAKGGYYQGEPNGKWDAETVAALQKFQSSHGIDASGKLDAATLQKLGLGSDIAGVSAPRRLPPTTSSGVTPSASSAAPSSPPSAGSSAPLASNAASPPSGAASGTASAPSAVK